MRLSETNNCVFINISDNVMPHEINRKTASASIRPGERKESDNPVKREDA
jgi:hypothetical protein